MNTEVAVSRGNHRAGCGCHAHAPQSMARRRVLGRGLLGALAASVGSVPLLASMGCVSTTPTALAPARRLLVKGGHVITMDAQLGNWPVADILIDGGMIAAIAPRLDVADAAVIDASRHIVVPGFVDTHRHLWEGVLRNALPDGSIGDYLRVILGRFGPLFRPQDVYAGNLVSALGVLDAGVTTVLDWSHIQNTPEHTDAAIQALHDSGIRAVFGYGAAQIAGKRWWDDDSHRYPEDLWRIQEQYISSKDQLLTLALAASGPHFGTQEVALREWRLAREAGIRLSTHLGVGIKSKASLEPLGRAGQLDIPATYIHCNHLSDTEWKMIADSGGTVSLSPLVEMSMGHGIPVTQTALDYGILPSLRGCLQTINPRAGARRPAVLGASRSACRGPGQAAQQRTAGLPAPARGFIVCKHPLGVDVETSAPADLFTQMRTVMAVQRGMVFERAERGEQDLPSPLTSGQMLEFATIGGARANGLDHLVGSLSPGKQADMVLLRTDAINVMPIHDPVGAVVQSMGTQNVDTVLVGGRILKRGGVLAGVDTTQVEAQVRASQAYLLGRAAQ